MENLGHDVAEIAVDAVAETTCGLKKLLPLAPVLILGSGGLVLFVGYKLWKKRKARKAEEVTQETEEVNPPEAE